MSVRNQISIGLVFVGLSLSSPALAEEPKSLALRMVQMIETEHSSNGIAASNKVEAQLARLHALTPKAKAKVTSASVKYEAENEPAKTVVLTPSNGDTWLVRGTHGCSDPRTELRIFLEAVRAKDIKKIETLLRGCGRSEREYFVEDLKDGEDPLAGFPKVWVGKKYRVDDDRSDRAWVPLYFEYEGQEEVVHFGMDWYEGLGWRIVFLPR